MNNIPDKIFLHIGKVHNNDFIETFDNNQVGLTLERLMDDDFEYILNKKLHPKHEPT